MEKNLKTFKYTFLKVFGVPAYEVRYLSFKKVLGGDWGSAPYISYPKASKLTLKRYYGKLGKIDLVVGHHY